jgi:hypothetical protein
MRGEIRCVEMRIVQHSDGVREHRLHIPHFAQIWYSCPQRDNVYLITIAERRLYNNLAPFPHSDPYHFSIPLMQSKI